MNVNIAAIGVPEPEMAKIIFGRGRHQCPGKSLALRELTLVAERLSGMAPEDYQIHSHRDGPRPATFRHPGAIRMPVSAAFGLGALMAANAWVFEFMRYAGAAYLLYLAWRSARSAWLNRPVKVADHGWNGRVGPEILRGFLIHLTNPKVVLFFASLYATGVPVDASPRDLAALVLLVGGQSLAIFIAYVLAFSSASVVPVYTRLARPFDTALAVMFTVFAVSLFFAKLSAT